MTVVRVARQEDVSALAALHLRSSLAAYSHIFPPDAPAPTFDRLLSCWQSWLGARGMSGFVVDTAAGEPVGVVLAGADPLDVSIGHVARMYVAPEQWGQGIGRCLHSVAIAHLQALGYERATLWVLEGNHRARGWYERRGWAATGERQAVFAPAAIHELRYRRDLNV